MSTIVATATAMLTEPTPWQMAATFVWTAGDPVAVQMTLSLHEELVYAGVPLNRHITWQFARELLDAALMSPGVQVGHGDITIEQLEKTLLFNVVGEGGHRHPVLVELEPVQRFMIETFMVTPAAYERPDVDAAISKILGAAS